MNELNPYDLAGMRRAAETGNRTMSKPTCTAQAGGCCTNRDCLVHKAAWDGHKAIEHKVTMTDLLSLADSLAEAARAIKKEYIANEGTKAAFASCMTEVSSYTQSASGKAMWRKWEKFMSALKAWDAARKG